MESEQAELQKSIDHFFYEPSLGRDSYRREFEQNFSDRFERESGVRYSPLLLLRGDLFFVLWRGWDFQDMEPDHGFDGIPVFTSLALIRAGIEFITKQILSADSDSPSDQEWTEFTHNFMAITDDCAKNIRRLRNCVLHDGYSLTSREIENGVTIKYSFGFAKLNKGSLSMWQDQIRKNYTLRLYYFDPWQLHQSFELGIIALGKKLRHDPTLLKRYRDRLSDMDQWVLVGEN